MNRCVFTGRLTRDPEMRTAAGSDMSIVRFGMAIDRRFKREGEQTADFINCVAFGKTAEFIEKYFKKGMKADIEARFQSSTYNDKNTGERRSSADFIIDNIEFGESKAARGESGNEYSSNGSGNVAGFMDIPNDIDEELPFN